MIEELHVEIIAMLKPESLNSLLSASVTLCHVAHNLLETTEILSHQVRLEIVLFHGPKTPGRYNNCLCLGT